MKLDRRKQKPQAERFTPEDSPQIFGFLCINDGVNEGNQCCSLKTFRTSNKLLFIEFLFVSLRIPKAERQ